MRRILTPFLFLSCTATAEKAVATAPVKLEPYSYSAAVTALPAGTTELVLTVELPPGELRALSASGLVGNAPFELSLANGDASLANPELALRWSAPGAGAGRLQLTTKGKPAEVRLRLGSTAALADVGALERELALRTSATADRRPLATVETRLRPLR